VTRTRTIKHWQVTKNIHSMPGVKELSSIPVLDPCFLTGHKEERWAKERQCSSLSILKARLALTVRRQLPYIHYANSTKQVGIIQSALKSPSVFSSTTQTPPSTSLLADQPPPDIIMKLTTQSRKFMRKAES